MQEKKFAVVGHPIGHTMSPFIHARLFEMSGQAASYTVLDIPPEELSGSLPRLRELSGFNVTIPHKQAIIPLLDELDSRSKALHSVNTVENQNGRLIGHTTDGTGFTKTLEAAGAPLAGEIAVLGAGGVSRVMAFEAAQASPSPHITIAVRPHSLPAAQELCEALSESLRARACTEHLISCCLLESLRMEQCGLILNGTPVGMHPYTQASPLTEEQVKRANPGAVVFDAVYNPGETMLLRMARAAGLKTVGGMGMLVWQAAAAQGIWNGSSFSALQTDVLCRDAEAEMARLFAQNR